MDRAGSPILAAAAVLCLGRASAAEASGGDGQASGHVGIARHFDRRRSGAPNVVYNIKQRRCPMSLFTAGRQMNIAKTLALIGLGLLWATASFAQQPPAGAPAGTTGLCKDGSYWSGATKRGACRGHKGVKAWYGAAGASAAAAPAPAMPPSSAGAPPSAAPAPGPARTRMRRGAPAPITTAAAGGGPGLVWVNHRSKVYHCSGDRYYGKTKDGEYISEADAKAKGYRPDHGKPCQ